MHHDNSSARFALTADGFLHQVGWVAPDDGLLAIDKQGDGLIDEFDEIAFRDYVEGARTDLEGLVFFDSNRDGVLNAQDANWSQFGVWQDIDQDGVTDAGEFKYLTDTAVNITEIGLSSDGVVEIVEGNVIFGTGQYSRGDGTTGQFGDVGLGYSETGTLENADGSVTIKKADGTLIRAAGDGPAGITVDLEAEGLSSAYGGAGGDTLIGGSGDEKLVGGGGSNIISGGAGDDIVVIDDGDALANISGGGGSDTLVDDGEAGRSADIAQYGFEAVVGGAGDDVYTTSAADGAALAGSAGNDSLSGHLGDDRIDGGSGDDVLSGGDGDDILIGSTGTDALYGGDGDDILTIDSDDRVLDDAGNLVMDAGAGFDLLIADGPMGLAIDLNQVNAEMAIGGIASDAFWTTGDGAVDISGQGGDDALFGGGGDDKIDGGSGDDALIGGGGADLLSGGIGRDTASYGGSDEGVTVNLATGRGQRGSAEGDVLQEIENLAGSDYDDVLTGDTGDNLLEGGEGGDVLAGGRGDDALEGGLGDDTYHYDRGDGVDHIRDDHWYQYVVQHGTDEWDTYVAPYEYSVLEPVTYTEQVLVTEYVTVHKQVDVTVGVRPQYSYNERGDEVEIIGYAYYDSTTGWQPFHGTVSQSLSSGDDTSSLQGTISVTVHHKEVRQEWRDVERTRYEFTTQNALIETLRANQDTLDITEWRQSEGGNDTLVFGEGITSADLIFGFDKDPDNPDEPDDLLIGLRDPSNPDAALTELSDRVRLVDWALEKSRIETIQFADGSHIDLTPETLLASGEGGENLTGTQAADVLFGLGGDDGLNGTGGADVLQGGAGNDVLWSHGGDDAVHGDSGDDSILGGDGGGPAGSGRARSPGGGAAPPPTRRALRVAPARRRGRSACPGRRPATRWCCA